MHRVPSFGQALIGTTSEKDVEMSQRQDLIIQGHAIGRDADNYFSLTDVWRLAGEEDHKSPRKWRTLLYAKELIRALEQNVRFKDVITKSHSKSAIYSKKGRNGGTFAHYILAVAYAEYLHPEIGVEVRDIATRVWGGDVSVLDDFNRRIIEQVKEDERRVHNREEITKRNKELARQGKKAGLEGWDYAKLHNSGYRGMYDGRDEDDIHALKHLGQKQKILDHMGAAEGAANVFRVTQAELRMKNHQPRTPEEAFTIAYDAGVITREAMKEISGIMPEDLPSADSISAARRRLKANKNALPQIK